MARYRVNQRSHINGALLEAGAEVVYDGVPGTNLDPLDDEAVKAKKAAERRERPRSIAVTSMDQANVQIARLEERLAAARDELRDEVESHKATKAKLAEVEERLAAAPAPAPATETPTEAPAPAETGDGPAPRTPRSK